MIPCGYIQHRIDLPTNSAVQDETAREDNKDVIPTSYDEIDGTTNIRNLRAQRLVLKN